MLWSSPAQAVCVDTPFGELCHQDLDPTPHIPGSADFAEQAWGEAGSAAYQAAANWMRANNGSSQSLDALQKQYLRPHFGDLVDRAAVVYNANLMDELSALGYRIPMNQSAAQTYCDRIYIDDPYQQGDLGQIILLAHELTHSRQCQDYGGAGTFGFHYFREYKRAGQSYENNRLEREAFAFEEQFSAWLDTQSVATSSFSSSPVFDPDFYLMSYGDLRNAFGTNQGAARNHWLTYGIQEGRRSSPAFDVQYYLSFYPDLQNAFSNDYTAAINHWLTYGIQEGRRSSIVFDVQYYLNRYSDLQSAFGAQNYSAAVDHWLTYGVSEGRQGSPDFDPSFYLSNNPDVARVYGASNYKGAIEHYLEFGRAEGRRGTAQ
ncbi:hypothetical protein H6F88_04680 [Oculatella sp. FACHB-28]|uniref:hypothetical protein n=1 Tax=Oculatella sp. FACHB-28 TaxID=2692845 RepID=UPI001686B5C3|nr:hypothetical protein [Oculatella sp. FACHB-28]MBD2055326.1 hypothetical protein [Oculatella sp. FACHB-28]